MHTNTNTHAYGRQCIDFHTYFSTSLIFSGYYSQDFSQAKTAPSGKRTERATYLEKLHQSKTQRLDDEEAGEEAEAAARRVGGGGGEGGGGGRLDEVKEEGEGNEESRGDEGTEHPQMRDRNSSTGSRRDNFRVSIDGLL